MKWPFSKSENRAGGSQQHTETEIAAIESRAHGIMPRPELLAVVEACAGIWERCIACATVMPDRTELAGVTSTIMALAGRNLAMQGNALFAIRVQGSMVRLIPASHWDLRGSAGAWRYRLDLAGPSATETVSLPAESVVHFRVGADSTRPWSGRSPLQRANLTGGLAGRIEKSLEDETRIPVTRLIRVNPEAVTGTSTTQLDEVKKALPDGGLVTMPPGMETDTIGPKPADVIRALRSDTGQDICSAFGISPALFSDRGDGAGQREAWRRLWLSTIAPIGRIIETELRAKLVPDTGVSFDALRAADTDGISRATQRKANAYKIYREAGLEDAEAKRLAGVANG